MEISTPPTMAPYTLLMPPTKLPAITAIRSSSENPKLLVIQRGMMAPARPANAPVMNQEAPWILNVSMPKIAASFSSSVVALMACHNGTS